MKEMLEKLVKTMEKIAEGIDNAIENGDMDKAQYLSIILNNIAKSFQELESL